MKMRRVLLACTLIVGVWGGWYAYFYFRDTTPPKVELIGLHEGDYCAGDVSCVLSSDKVGTITVWLDNKQLITQLSARANAYDYSFLIPSKTLSDGGHHLKIEFSDKSFNKNTVMTECDFNIDNIPLQATFLQSDAQYKVAQGRTLHLKLQTNKQIKSAKVYALSQTFDCVSEINNLYVYECFMPIACEEQPNEYLLSVDVTDNVQNTVHLDHTFRVLEYQFKKEVLSVSHDKVKKEQQEGPGEKEFEDLIARVTCESPKEKLWRGSFCTPTDIQRVSCPFGTIRTTQHKGRYAHKALDVLNYPKSVVWAPQDGIIVVKDRFAASGNTVVIDHGCGIISMVFHLEEFADIEIGDKVAQGNPLGKLGKTGYATGYHLHWEQRVNNIAIDPMEWTKETF